MDMQKALLLFAAHSPTPEGFKLRSEHAFTEDMSIATLIKAVDNVMPAFDHSHDAYEFIIPHTPIPFLTRNNAVYFGEVDYVYPVPPGFSHGVKYDISDVSHTDIVFDKDYFENMLWEYNTEGCEYNYIFRITDDLKTHINMFKREFANTAANQGGGTGSPKLKHLAKMICVEIVEQIVANLDMDGRNKLHGYQKGIHAVAQYMNSNYMHDLTVAELAEMTGFSTNYFSTAFLNMLGLRPQAYLNKLRISKAKQLIAANEKSIADISVECGFKNQSSFASLFKKMTGQTPTQYRSSFRK